jgi:hypothetical protein
MAATRRRARTGGHLRLAAMLLTGLDDETRKLLQLLVQRTSYLLFGLVPWLVVK